MTRFGRQVRATWKICDLVPEVTGHVVDEAANHPGPPGHSEPSLEPRVRRI